MILQRGMRECIDPSQDRAWLSIRCHHPQSLICVPNLLVLITPSV